LKALKEKASIDHNGRKKLPYNELKENLEKNKSSINNFDIYKPRMLAAAELGDSGEEKTLKELLQTDLGEFSNDKDSLAKIEKVIEKLKKFKDEKGKDSEQGKALKKITLTTDFDSALVKFIEQLEKRRDEIAKEANEKDENKDGGKTN